MGALKEIEFIITTKGCWKCTSHILNVSGYVHLCRNGKRTSGHRYMYEQKYGRITNEVIRHICDNRWCINPDHLIEGTHNDNVQDRVGRNRSAVGENNGRTKLTEEQVIEIFNDNDTLKTHLAKKFNVDLKTINNIKNKITWKYLTRNKIEA